MAKIREIAKFHLAKIYPIKVFLLTCTRFSIINIHKLYLFLIVFSYIEIKPCKIKLKNCSYPQDIIKKRLPGGPQKVDRSNRWANLNLPHQDSSG